MDPPPVSSLPLASNLAAALFFVFLVTSVFFATTRLFFVLFGVAGPRDHAVGMGDCGYSSLFFFTGNFLLFFSFASGVDFTVVGSITSSSSVGPKSPPPLGTTQAPSSH